MTCKDISRALASGGQLPSGADAHLRACPSCQRLATILEQHGAEAELSPEAEARCIAAVTGELKPVSAVGPPWRYAAAILTGAAVVAVTGIAFLGRTGWATSSTFQQWYFATFLAAGIVVSATVLSRLMIPGTLQRLSPALLAATAVIPLFTGALLYPLAEYEQFAQSVAACFVIGTLHALGVGALGVVLLRRGFVVSWAAAAAVAGLTGGLTGFVVLFVFCPHHDAGHYVLAHVGAVVFAMAAGPALACASDRLRHWK